MDDATTAGTRGKPKSSSRPLISIIIPVFNEEDNVERTYSELKRVTAELGDFQFEFLFTDNHSTDRTFERLSKIAAADADVRIARFARNFGFQQSVLTGYRLARGAAATTFPELSNYLLYSVTPRVLKGDPGGLHWQVQWQERAFPHRRWLVVRVYMKTGHVTSERLDAGQASP